MDQQFELLDRVDGAVLERRLQAERADDQVAQPAQRPDRRVEDAHEEVHRRDEPEGGPLGALEGDVLRDQLTEDDVQGGGDGEGEHQRDDGHRVRREDGALARQERESVEERLEQTGDRRLGDVAEAERGHGDAELGGGDDGLDARQRPLHLADQ